MYVDVDKAQTIYCILQLQSKLIFDKVPFKLIN